MSACDPPPPLPCVQVVRFWDMETLKCVDQTNTDATAIRAICFHSMGSNIFTALQDGMRVWGWEPAVQQDYVDVPWYKVRTPPLPCHAHARTLTHTHTCTGPALHASMVLAGCKL